MTVFQVAPKFFVVALQTDFQFRKFFVDRLSPKKIPAIFQLADKNFIAVRDDFDDFTFAPAAVLFDDTNFNNVVVKRVRNVLRVNENIFAAVFGRDERKPARIDADFPRDVDGIFFQFRVGNVPIVVVKKIFLPAHCNDTTANFAVASAVTTPSAAVTVERIVMMFRR